jgi:hypothetical protein
MIFFLFAMIPFLERLAGRTHETGLANFRGHDQGARLHQPCAEENGAQG